MLEIKSVGIVSPRNSKPRKRTTCIAVHCSATAPEQDVGAREIDRWHRAQGWACIGYHFVIRRDGTVEAGRNPELPGAHVAGHNHYTLGVCMVGGVDANGKPENNFTPAQFATLAGLLTELRKEWPAVTEVKGHRDFPGVKKACPSFDVRAWIKSLP